MAAVTISLVLYYATHHPAPAKAGGKKKKKTGPDDDDDKGGRSTSTAGRSVNFSDKAPTSSDAATPRKSNETTTAAIAEEKEMHAKIEELDKKGKALFKNKQVRSGVAFGFRRPHIIVRLHMRMSQHQQQL